MFDLLTGGTMKELFEQFLKEKQYLKSVSKKTLIFYQQSLRAYQRIMGEAEFSKASLKDFVIGLRESGVSTASINCCAFLPADEVRTASRSKLDPVAIIRASTHCAGIHPENFVAFESEIGEDLLD